MGCLGTPRELPVALFMKLAFGEFREETSLLQCKFPLPGTITQKKRVLGLYYIHLLCVNKCLQFYIKEEISDRVSGCIFFTFLIFETVILYMRLMGELR